MGFYTNFEISRLDFWRSKKYKLFWRCRGGAGEAGGAWEEREEGIQRLVGRNVGKKVAEEIDLWIERGIEID